MSFLADLFSLTGRVAVVTGGSSGIGAGMAAALARAGAQVVLVARDAGRLGSAAAGLRARGGEVSWVSADLADRDGLERAADEAAAAFGPPDILLNCAGINLRPPLASLTAADWDLTLAVNLTAPFLLGQRFGPSMAARGWGRIINVTSQQASAGLLEQRRVRGVQGRPGRADPVAVRGVGALRRVLQLGVPGVRRDPAQRGRGRRP